MRVLCQACRQPFEAHRRSAKFCSPTCRQRHRRHPENYRLKAVAPSGDSVTGLALVPLSFKDACELIERWHRHHAPPQAHLFSIGCVLNGELVGCVIVNRPAARHYNGQGVAEVSRLATDGTPHVASKLYAAAARACTAMGYRRMQTYILEREPGTSLKAAGWTLADKVANTNWGHASRRGAAVVTREPRLRWVRDLAA